jgi:hypothetical protein
MLSVSVLYGEVDEVDVDAVIPVGSVPYDHVTVPAAKAV